MMDSHNILSVSRKIAFVWELLNASLSLQPLSLAFLDFTISVERERFERSACFRMLFSSSFSSYIGCNTNLFSRNLSLYPRDFLSR